MTLEERINRSVCRLAVLDRLFSLEGLKDAVHVGSCDKEALQAGIGELILATYEDLEPISNAPVEVTNWEPEGERTAQPAAG